MTEWSFDIESEGLHPIDKRVVNIAVYNPKKGIHIFDGRKSEHHCILDFQKWICDQVTASDTPHLISYNGIEFDIPFLSIRAKKYGLDFVFPPHIDIFHNLNGRLKWQKLDSWCEFYGIPVGSNLKGIDVIDTYSTGDWAKAEKHVTDDVHKTWNIWEKVKEFVIW